MKVRPLGPILVAIAVPAALTFASTQKQLVYVDSVKNPRIKIVGKGGFWIPDDSFEFKGNVQVDHFVEKFKLTCEKAVGKFVTVANKTEIDKVSLTGGVHAVKSSDSIVLSADGNQADYNIEGDNRNLKLHGGVILDVKSSGKEPSAWHVTGASANVNMKKSGDFLNSAKLEGPLVFNGTQLKKVKDKQVETKFKVKAREMTYASRGESGNAEIRLSGDIEIVQQEGSDEASISGAELLVLELNQDRQIIKVRFSSGGGDRQIKTTVTKSGSGNA